VPIYEYRCDACGRTVEEYQQHFEDPPPESTEICPEAPSDQQAPCRLERIISVANQKWNGDYSNDGRGGWVRQGDAMVKMQKGKESTRYGEGVG